MKEHLIKKFISDGARGHTPSTKQTGKTLITIDSSAEREMALFVSQNKIHNL